MFNSHKLHCTTVHGKEASTLFDIKTTLSQQTALDCDWKSQWNLVGQKVRSLA